MCLHVQSRRPPGRIGALVGRWCLPQELSFVTCRAKWFVNFISWMVAATTVNSGLRYTESLLAAEFRSALTRAAHAKYLAHNAFYKTSVLRQGSLDHVDQRICSDIGAFSKEVAAIYGHSFKRALLTNVCHLCADAPSSAQPSLSSC